MSDVRHAQISERAYAIWEREGRPEGRDQIQWEQAIRELDEAENDRLGSPRNFGRSRISSRFGKRSSRRLANAALHKKNFGLTHHRRKTDMSKIAEIAYGFREDDLTPVILVAYDDGQVHAFTKLQPTGWVKAIAPEALDRTRPLDKADFDRMFPGIDPLLIPPRENP